MFFCEKLNLITNNNMMVSRGVIVYFDRSVYRLRNQVRCPSRILLNIRRMVACGGDEKLHIYLTALIHSRQCANPSTQRIQLGIKGPPQLLSAHAWYIRFDIVQNYAACSVLFSFKGGEVCRCWWAADGAREVTKLSSGIFNFE